MSMADREAKWAIRWTRWAGQSRLVQNVSLSPGSRMSGLPQLGQVVGNFHARARRGRRPFLPLAAPAAEPPAAAAPAAAAPLPAAPSVDASPALPAPGPSTGPTTSGITSPALRTMTVSPGRTSLRATWSSLWRVASDTVEPPTNTGSSTANGVALPVRPMDTAMSLSRVVRSSGGNL